ncbi:hypothetical protein [Flagellimonas marinaquae]|nr:hypothetical protein [Allomuricauda aquimarina]
MILTGMECLRKATIMVTDEVIMEYIKNQDMEREDGDFRIGES